MKKLTLGTVTIIAAKTQWLRLKITTGGVHLNGYVYHSQNGEPATTLTATDKFGYQTPNTSLTKTCLKGRLTGKQLTEWVNMIGGNLIGNTTGGGFNIPAEMINRFDGLPPTRPAYYWLDDTQTLELIRALDRARTAARLSEYTGHDRDQRLVRLAKQIERQRLDMNEYNRIQNRYDR